MSIISNLALKMEFPREMATIVKCIYTLVLSNCFSNTVEEEKCGAE